MVHDSLKASSPLGTGSRQPAAAHFRRIPDSRAAPQSTAAALRLQDPTMPVLPRGVVQVKGKGSMVCRPARARAAPWRVRCLRMARGGARGSLGRVRIQHACAAVPVSCGAVGNLGPAFVVVEGRGDSLQGDSCSIAGSIPRKTLLNRYC